MPPKSSRPAAARPIEEGYSYDALRPLVAAALEAGLSVLVRGHPGIGKSALAADLARAMDRRMLDIRLAQRDPAEVCGVYFPNRERQVLELFPPGWVREACEAPCFVFLDEINAAVTKLHQAAAYQIVLEHRVGDFHFHEGTVVMAAGNLEEDRAIVTPLSSALCNRFAHYTMRAEVESWLRWAAAHGIDGRIMSFVKAHGEEVLYQAGDDYAFPTPRSWEMASKVLQRAQPGDAKRAVAACVGAAMADRLFRYFEVYQKVPAEAIVLRGEPIDFTKGRHAEPSFVYAAVFAVATFVILAKKLEPVHLAHIVKFLRSDGLDPEYQILFLRQVRERRADVVERMKPLAEFRKLAGQLVDLKASLYLEP